MSNKLLIHLTEVRSLPEITLEKLVNCLKGEALVVLCLVAILPFMQPVPIPGLSTLLGLIVLMQGVGMMFWSKPLLTERMKKVQITHEKFEIIFKAAQKFAKITEKISLFKHPWTNSKASHFTCGFAIVLSSLFLSLPLPIPFSNFVPALSIALICVGLLEEDIILLVIGLGITLAVIWMGVFSYHILRDQIHNWF